MATAPVLLSVEEYLRTSYKPDLDFVEGELEERNVGEQPHSRLQGFFVHAFLSNQPAWRLEPLVEQRIRVDSSRVRVCDVAVTPVDAAWEDVLTAPPVLCIEILSPEDRIPRAEQVLADYFAMGVRNIWLIDPIRRAAYTFGASGLQLGDVTSLQLKNSDVRIDLTPVFDRIESQRNA